MRLLTYESVGYGHITRLWPDTEKDRRYLQRLVRWMNWYRNDFAD